ncbi:ribonuclease HII [Telmatospirillum sp. J64-1]|uniref:ribonuclease HII n=1 Tax=Telmatospirillum sp. J64-1 TaxID=2502183 RepID=UPI00115E2E47|nr:ribonuclease HII [Telmatospirillum sp. J64-1]
MPNLDFERAAGGLVCGIDEAGRGPLAGPVVAAAVIIDEARLPGRLLSELDDSKALSAKKREALFALLPECATIGVGIASVAEIDRHNILRATFLAMGRAVEELGTRPDLALVDGNQTPPLPCPVRCVIGGDAKCLSIAAASIIAKVTRDRIMAQLAGEFPGYGWEKNAGYGTAQHREAMRSLGVTPHHRRSFAPCADLLALAAQEDS